MMFFFGLVVLDVLSPIELSAQTYQERRDAILDKQNQTRSEIEELSSRIREFEQQINATENEV
jgi:prefoldin subunit 5